MGQKFSWIAFYSELASKMREYQNNPKTLLSYFKEAYGKTNLKYPFIWHGDEFDNIDPFTAYASFNKGIKDENKMTILKSLKESIGISAKVPEDFFGIPVLNSQSAWYASGVRKDEADKIKAIWSLFNSAIEYADKPSDKNKKEFIRVYDDGAQRFHFTWNTTMGLFWIRPMTYLNVDGKNRKKLISLVERFPADYPLIDELKTLPDGEHYLNLIEECKNCLIDTKEFDSFPDLSYSAWEDRKKEQASTTAIPDDNDETVHYWIYSPGEGSYLWDDFYKKSIMAIGWGEVGDLSKFKTKEDMKKKMKECYGKEYSYRNAALATWQFANEMKPGDVIFAKKGMHKIIGKGTVASDYYYDPKLPDNYNHARQVSWTEKGEWDHPGQAVMKTLTDITAYTDYIEKLDALFSNDGKEDEEEKEITYPAYGEEDFLNEVFMNEDEYHTLSHLLEAKKNVILQGAPGVGKTFVAKRLAYSMMGTKDPNRVSMIQFHQSYSYEDFIMGYRPSDTGFILNNGPFYKFCKAAEEDSENDYYFIIDEINRGNLGKIFGELFMLIENDKRGISLQLLYSNEKFSVPKNLYIIGMMNTADRSLAMMDYALRRRFAFYEIQPAFESDGFRKYQAGKGNIKFDRLIETIKQLNIDIEKDETLGKGFRIGHSYFCTEDDIDDEWLNSVVSYELVPLLNEYWFDEPQNVQDWERKLKEAIK